MGRDGQVLARKGIRVIDSLASDFLWDVYTQLNPQTGDREIEIKSGD